MKIKLVKFKYILYSEHRTLHIIINILSKGSRTFQIWKYNVTVKLLTSAVIVNKKN